MPILELSTTSLKQECIVCGAVHTIALKQGMAKAKKGPYALANGDTLEVKVDGQSGPQVVPFATADFANIGAASAAEVAAKIASRVTGAIVDVDGDAVRIVSASTARATSSIEVSGGSARDKLGFTPSRKGPRVLGVTIGAGASKMTAPDTIELPTCPDCGSKENLIRTWDVVPAEHGDSLHAAHRRHVNSLAQHLRATGYSEPDAKVKHDAETTGPPDVLPSFPANPSAPLPSMRRPSRDNPGRP
jgi:hypothetical protein